MRVAAGHPRTRALAVFAPLLAGLLACVAPPPIPSDPPFQAERPVEIEHVYQVAEISDGDTLAVRKGMERIVVRLGGIDAPEAGQDFGQVSKRNLAAMTNGRSVELVGDKTDRYGRRVAKVLVDGRDVNLEQIRAGLAWHYKRYESEQPVQDRAKYASEEQAAKEAKTGLWSRRDPVPPWEWRAGLTEKNLEGVPEGAVIGNRNSLLYHTPGCSTYGKVSARNRVVFASRAEAESSGYRLAGSCK